MFGTETKNQEQESGGHCCVLVTGDELDVSRELAKRVK